MNLSSNATAQQQDINCTTTWSSYETNRVVNNCSYSLYTGKYQDKQLMHCGANFDVYKYFQVILLIYVCTSDSVLH